MSLLSTYILSCFLSVAMPTESSPGVATVQDSVKTVQDSLAASRGFNALEYRLQKRYRPKDEPFVNNSFMDNLYLKLNFGAFQLAKRDYSSFSWGGIGGLEVGKAFDRYNSISLGLSGMSVRRNVDGSKVSGGGIEAMHHFDISSYLSGYRSSRTVSVSTLEAVGFDLSNTDGEWYMSGHIRLGFDVNFQINKMLDVFLEPFISFYTDGLDGYNNVSWQSNDNGFGISSGLVFRLPSGGIPSFKQFISEIGSLGLSRDVSAGFAFQASDLVASTVGFLPSSREAASVALGIPLSGPVSVRMSVFYSRDVWKRLVGSVNKFSYYFGLRGEVMFDPMYYFKDIKKYISLPLFLGPEYGWMLKYDHSYDIKRQYLGLSTGFQLRYNAFSRLAVYLEPHLSIVPYNYRRNLTDSLSSATSNYYDTIYSFLLGVSIPL